MAVRAGELPPFPDGWYCVASSEEVPAGQLLSRPFCGEEVVAFRGADGVVGVVDAYCPHLGAHMGVGGTVEGNTLRCPFHGFRFDATGRCVGTAYGTKPPPTAVVACRQVVERNGLILAWHGPAAPTFEVPQIDDTNWTPTAFRRMTLESHPQETTENSVDLGHLGAVHGYRDVEMRGETRIDGPYLGLSYTMTRANPFLFGMGAITTDFDVHVHGLGYSLVDIQPRNPWLHMRLWVLPSPRDGRTIDLRIGVSVERRVGLPYDMAERVIRSFSLRAVAHDVQQDFDIWRNKRWVARPAIAVGDGPLPVYRKWCRQFYPTVDEAVAS